MSNAAEQSRARMAQAALDLFVTHSYEGTSLQMIASRLGVTKPAISYHFGTKEDLLAAVAAPAFADLERYFAGLEAQRTKAARRRQALTGYVDLLVKHRGLMALLLQDAGAARSPVLHERLVGLTEQLLQLFVSDPADTAERVYTAAALGGLRDAAGSFPELQDAELRAHLQQAGRRMLARPPRRAAGAQGPPGEPG